MFKKGDSVKCTGIANGLTLGDIYTIVSTMKDNNINWVIVTDNDGDEKIYKDKRFELIEKSKELRPLDIVRKYKKGDRVTCLYSPKFRGITKGDTYEVVEDEMEEVVNRGVIVEDDENMCRRYSRSYFLLSKEAEPKLARPFQVGDKVSFGGLEGEVRHLCIFRLYCET